jgi:hypothetical protein
VLERPIFIFISVASLCSVLSAGVWFFHVCCSYRPQKSTAEVEQPLSGYFELDNRGPKGGIIRQQ